MRPPPVRIDDLAEPRFSPEAQTIRHALAELAPALPLIPDVLMKAAGQQTGLDDFGDDWFREPLDVLCTSLREEANLSPSGAATLALQLIQAMITRLRLTHLLKHNPEIRDVPIERPIVIAGLPRTGTTHLHNLMSADRALRSLPYWESLEPLPPPGDDDRIERARANLEALDVLMPHFKRMHDMGPEHVNEEITLFGATASSIVFEAQAPIPAYRDWLRRTDQTPAYEYLRTMLQALQWLRPDGERWLLKSPGHLEQLKVLTKVFPDAFVVVTHRDPVAVTRSICTMFAYSARMTQDRPDPAKIGGYWAHRFELLLTSCLAGRHLLTNAMDVHFGAFMADDLAMVRRVYEQAGQPFTAQAATAMAAFLEAHPRGKHGGVVYDLADFGIDPAEREQAFAAYTTHFGVRSEK